MSKYRGSDNSDCKVYVGHLGSSASKPELEDSFSYYGPIRNIWISRNPPGFAFVQFDDPRDAQDAVSGLDGKFICGRRVRVEISSGKRKRGFQRLSNRRGRIFHSDDHCYGCGERGHYAKDCQSYRKGQRRSYSRSRSHSRSKHTNS